MTREEPISSNHRHNLMRIFGRPDGQARHFSLPELPERACERVGHANAAAAGVDAMVPDGWCPTPAFSIEQTSGKLRRIDDAREV